LEVTMVTSVLLLIVVSEGLGSLSLSLSLA
jgi:hypothetical protein